MPFYFSQIDITSINLYVYVFMTKTPNLEDMALKGFPVTEQTNFFKKIKQFKARKLTWKIDILIVVDVTFSADLIVSPSSLPF